MPPGRSEPLPETSNGEEFEGDRGDDGGERGMPIEDDADESNMAINEGKDGSRTYWHAWKTNLLIEVKKEEIIAQLTRQTSRSKFDRNDRDEWERTRETMASCGVHLKANQLKNKYNNLLSDYRKIKDWNRHNGVQLFWSMMRVDRRKEKLPMKFLEVCRSGAENVDTEKEARTNSGIKRKKNCSKSATMLVDVLERMSQDKVFVIQEVEKGRIAKEDA
ncbi:hypothetical protein R1flu_013310 [Riccia fluitans]|uniref:Myb/SANT-like DNA-binding domain-containing protein n=1 Tax=Riccia fluitans TaxID=41844 RepID=A0ABD1YCV9_9MARC